MNGKWILRRDLPKECACRTVWVRLQPEVDTFAYRCPCGRRWVQESSPALVGMGEPGGPYHGSLTEWVAAK